ncbi:MFS transporter [Enterobacteriaceae bacterium BIT-l23]|uniref:MFS transporter n=1 Tax=Jejubacter sp. L23 TaxID=3092086 RepID=UPI001584EB20|nr:MFS transporter [Enterobacteriaceae bacterium BIT-l23]
MNIKESSIAAPRDEALNVARRGYLRYIILALIFVVTVINYADRAILSIAGTSVAQDVHLDPMQLGMVFSAFGWAYALGQVPGGWLLDRFGARRVYGCSIVLWSLFTALQGLVESLGLMAISAMLFLFVMRFALGLVEAPAFPANSRIVTCWFPTRERGTASSLFNSAQYLAVAIFTPLMAWLTASLGWQHVFFVMGGVGLALGVVWFWFYHEPHQHRRLSGAEMAHMRANGALVDMELNRKSHREPVTWHKLLQLFRHRNLWAVYIGQYCITALTYFFITWFPIYLIKERGMSILEAGFSAAIPAVCGFTGGILGGVLSDYLIRKGAHPSLARKIPFTLGMFLAMGLVLTNFVDANAAVIGLMAVAFFGKGLSAVGWATMSDIAPAGMIGLSGGVFNGLGNIAGIVTPVVIGYVVSTTGSFSDAIWFVALHCLVGLLAYAVIARRFERVVITG